MFESPKPKTKMIPNDIYNGLTTPCGLMWNSQNYSCAYDALFTMLLSIWHENPSKMKKAI